MQVAETMPSGAGPAAVQRARPGLYIAIVVFALLAAFGYRQRINGIFACPATGYAADAYLSDCLARNYGDFDHGSFWYGLDGPSRESAKRSRSTVPRQQSNAIRLFRAAVGRTGPPRHRCDPTSSVQPFRKPALLLFLFCAAWSHALAPM